MTCNSHFISQKGTDCKPQHGPPAFLVPHAPRRPGSSYYQQQGQDKAVIGGFDPSARKFMKTDELTFTVSLAFYEKMLAALPDSMFAHETDWKSVRKKVDRSAKAWGEENRPPPESLRTTRAQGRKSEKDSHAKKALE